MVYKWRDYQSLLVLDLLKKQECLWNKKSKYYRNFKVREKAMEEMVKQLNISGLKTEDIKLKIKTIRSKYSAELAKVLKSERSGARQEEIYEPKLFWFKEADVFLRDVCTPRSWHPSTLKKNKVLPKRSMRNRVRNQNIDEQSENSFSESELISTEFEEGTRDSLERKQQMMQELRTGLKRPIVLYGLQAEKNTPEKFRRTDENCERETEFDLFAKSLAVQLNNMPLKRAIVCQQKLQQIMIEERLFQLRETDAEPQSISSLDTSSNSSFLSSHSSNTVEPVKTEVSDHDLISEAMNE